MPRINLLPAKKIARQEELRAELRSLCYLAVGLVLCIAAHASAQSAQVDRKRQMLVEAQGAQERAAGRLKELDELKAGLLVLNKKIAVIDSLEAQKHGPSLLLGTFAEVLSDHPKVWLSKLEQVGEVIKMAGFAMTQEDISAFQADLAKHQPVVSNVTLLLVNSSKEGAEARTLEWSMSCRAPLEQGKEATGPSPAGPGAPHGKEGGAK